MISTTISVLGILSLFYSLKGSPTWVKIVCFLALVFLFLIVELKKWAFSAGNLTLQFVVRRMLSCVCMFFKIEWIVYPFLLSIRSEWACCNQGFGYVLLVDEGETETCGVFSRSSVAYRRGRHLPIDTMWTSFELTQQVFDINYLSVWFDFEDGLRPDEEGKLELWLNAKYKHYMWEEDFFRQWYKVPVERVKNLVACLKYWESHPKMGIISRQNMLAKFWVLLPKISVLHCVDIAELAEHTLDRGYHPALHEFEHPQVRKVVAGVICQEENICA